MRCVKTLKLLTLFIVLALSSKGLACGIERSIEELSMAETDYEREDILYSLSSSLLFCPPEEYGRAMKATFDYTEFGPFFMKSYLFQYQQYFQNSYQIGSSWNRKSFEELTVKGLDRYILQVGTATGVYLGKYNGKSLIATNRHVIEDEVCSELEISSIHGVGISCDEILNPQSELDYAFILSSDEINLNAIRINNKKVESKTPFITGGRGYYRNEEQSFKEESSELCMKFLEDKLGESMGCDSSPGDSGSPVFLKESSSLYGLANSTGSYILDFSNEEVHEMISDEKYVELINLQSSHLVPFYRILEDRKQNISNEVKDILNCIDTKGCLR